MIRKLLSLTCLHAKSMGRFFYAVGRGKQTGVFPTWGECELQVKGFPGARFKKFGTEAEAWDFVEATNDCSSAPEPCSSAPKSCSSAPKPWGSSWAKGVSSTASSSKRSYSGAHLKRLYSTDSVDPSPKKKQRTASAASAPSTSGYPSGSSDNLVVYTDGACSHNGFSGAKAGLGVYWGDNHPLNTSARLEGKQTNQRAELTAALRALEQINEHHKRRKVTLYTDSKYTINCVTDWIHRWKKNGWKTAQKTDVINKEDLVKLDKLNRELDVKWEYVPGHKNVYGNEKADKLAREGATQPLPGNPR